MPTSSSAGNAGAGRLVLDELQCTHQTAGLRLADERMLLRQRRVGGSEVGPDVIAHALDESEFADQGDVGDRDRASDRMPRVGIAVLELAASVDER